MKTHFVTILVLLVCTAKAQYSENRKIFNYKDYTYQVGDRYDPTLTGVASFLLPGLGQVVAGESRRGLAFFGAYLGSYILILDASHNAYNEDEDEYELDYSEKAKLTIGLVGFFTSAIWSITDAIRVAKVNNMAMRKDNQKMGFAIEPVVIPQYHSNRIAGGLKLNIRLN